MNVIRTPPRERLRPFLAISPEQHLRSPAEADIKLAHDVSDILMRHYPGHPWAVNADHDQGVIYIWNCGLARRQGMVLHIAKSDRPAILNEKVIRAGGEFLERFNIPRHRPGRDEDYRERMVL